MKLVCIGTINRDVVQFAEGRGMETLGGALYSILALSVFCGGAAEIIPVANVGQDIYQYLSEILRHQPNLNTSGLKRIETDNNTVYLYLTEGKEREEQTDLNLPPIEYRQIEPYLDCEALMMNFTSGFELSFDTVRKIVDNCSGLIYIDIHSLSLGIDANRRRIRRKLPEGFRWIEGADFVQLNEGETLAFLPPQSPHISPEETAKALVQRLKQACLLTRGASGVTVFTSASDFSLPAKKMEKVIDSTGCGDVFGAAFLTKFLESKDIRKSAEFGCIKAGEKCGYAGWENYIKSTKK